MAIKRYVINIVMRLNAAPNDDLTRKLKVDLGGPKFGVLR